jgi:hypothetical protein
MVVDMSLRLLVLLAAIPGVAVAQTTGGSFGSGGRDRGGASSDTGSKGRGGSSGSGSSGWSSKPVGGGTRAADPWAARHAEAARAAAEAREQRFRSEHRLAGAAALLTDEASRVQPLQVSNAPTERTRIQRDGDAFFGLVFGAIFSGAIGLFAFMLLTIASEKLAAPLASLADKLPRRPRYATARKVMLAFDWNARRALQGALKALAEEPMGTDRERRDLVRALAKELQAHSRSVRYMKVVEQQGDPWELDEQLERDTRTLRKRYTVETVGRARKQVEVFARPIEGNGLLVVSVLTLFDRKLELRHGWRPVDAVLRMLSVVPPVQRLEVVWSPSEDSDRLSSAELEILYPELHPVDRVQVGRASCSQCGSVYALELGKCPACGSKEAERTASKATPACPYCGAAMPAHETQCRSCNAFVNRAG